MSTEPAPISEREREILRLVATGATNQQIAHQLNISINTVKVHLRNIFGKIGAASRTEATLYAVRSGLVRVGEALVVSAADIDARPTPDAELTNGGNAPAQLSTVAEKPEFALAQEPPALIATAGNELAVPVAQELPVQTLGRDGPVVAPVPSRFGRWLVSGAVLALLGIAALIFILARLMPTTPPPTTAPTASIAVPEPSLRWRELADLPAGRSGFALAGYSYSGKQYLYAIGGDLDGKASNEALRYDPTANIWTKFANKPTAVSDIQAAVIGNKLFVPGGQLAAGMVTDHFEAYDPQLDRWTTLKPLPQPRSGYALAAVEGKLYLFGGWDGSTYRAEVWQYNPDLDTWSERRPMRVPRAYGSAVALDGAIYIVGGENQDGALSANEGYNPAEDSGTTNPWTTQAPLPAPRSHIAAATTSGRMFVLGGAGAVGQLFVYTNNQDSWQTHQIPLDELRDVRALAIGDKLYILGGRDSAASPRVYEYQAVYNVLLPLKT
jgi:DNA-binding CsgD family transcriptional regulator